MGVDGHASAERRQIGAGLGNGCEGEAGERKGGNEEASVEGESSEWKAAVRRGTSEGTEEEGVGSRVGSGNEMGVGGGARCDGEAG